VLAVDGTEPVPETGTVVALLLQPLRFPLFLSRGIQVKERLPFTVPLGCGAKETLKLALCPAASVTGRAGPFRLKPEPVTVAWETVRFEPPELPTTSACTALLPTGTLPKVMLDGLTVSCAVDTSEYRKMFSRTSPQPITLHDKQGHLTAWPFLHRANAARPGDMEQLHRQ
jgi:hypothetical protein